MIRTLIFVPNAGVALAHGGGNNFCVKLANALHREFDQEVTVAGYTTLGSLVIQKENGMALDASIVGGGSSLKAAPFGLKASAYTALIFPGFRDFVRSTLKSTDTDIVWFNDDIPKCALPYLEGKTVYLYVHYPFRARFFEGVDKSRFEAFNERALSWMDLVDDHPEKHASKIMVNSSVTADAVKKLWGVDPEVVYTYAEGTPASTKQPLILSVGNLQKQKRQLDVVEAFLKAKLTKRWELDVIGQPRDGNYTKAVKRLIDGAPADRKVDYLPFVERDELNTMFSNAAAIVQAGMFEPFGLSLLEGMTTGCLPICRKSALNGGWRDILEQGKYDGESFETVDDLVSVFERLDAVKPSVFQQAIERSKAFSYEAFKSRLHDVLDSGAKVPAVARSAV